MISEIVFQNAIRTGTGGIGTLLMYADWLEEQGESRKAELARKRAKRRPKSTGSGYGSGSGYGTGSGDGG